MIRRAHTHSARSIRLAGSASASSVAVSSLLAFIGALAVGCAAEPRVAIPDEGLSSSFVPAETPGPSGGTPGFNGDLAKPTEVVANLRGTVFAPNGTVPVAGALVYLTKQKPEATPAKVYCDSCVVLAPKTPHAIANEKGEYSLPVTEIGTQFIVIQKGGFRRVREIYVSKGDERLPNTLSTLPGKTDAATGDEVPRMTVVHGQYDEIEASLQKLGIDPSAIDIVQSPLVGVAASEFLRSATRMNDRHIVFLPCGDFTQPTPNVDLSSEKAVQDNLRAFVEAGGRLYVTDWHYDFVARTFPGFVKFSGASHTACSGCERIAYDAQATVNDTGLASWMTAQNLTSFTLQRNYTNIDGVDSVTTAGKTVTPRVWVSGAKPGGAPKPATVSFEQGCGRVLFSTYHTEPFATQLTPQERALLGVLLEVSVCNDSPSGVVIK